MIQAIVSDLARTLLFPKDKEYTNSLNEYYEKVADNNNFDFFDHFTFNQELFDIYNKYSEGVDLYIFTASIMQYDPEFGLFLKNHFKKIISLDDINTHTKKNNRAYEELCENLRLFPNEIVFIDDNIKNCIAAGSVGIKVHNYKSAQEVDEWLHAMFSMDK